MIRDAIHADMEAIAPMCREFVAFTPYSDIVTASDDEMQATISSFIEHGKFLVAEVDGCIIGMLVAIIAPIWYAPRFIIATELAWWVAPTHRNGTAAIRLIQAFEQWAKDSGAHMVCMSNLETGDDGVVERMLRRMGYARVEQSHTKRIS